MAHLAAVLMVIMVLSVCFEIVSRYFFNRPTEWNVGMVEYILFCITFLGTGALLRKDGHVRVDLGLNLFAPRGRALLNFITSCAGLVSSGIMVWYGSKTTLNLLVRGVMTAQDPEIPKCVFIGLIPLGFFFVIIEFTKMAIDSLASLKNWNK